jgi:hypothetical protein
MGKKEKEPCAFCPATAEITGEHIWSDWAGKLFGTHKFVFTRKESDGSVVTWEHNALHLKAKVVCRTCNNEWMSELENKTKSLIADMVCNCTPATLNGEAIATIAALGFLKCVVADHMSETTKPFYTSAERQSFRRTLAIPDGVQMWLASTLRLRGLFKGFIVQTPLNTPQRFGLNTFTYGLGHLVIQIVGCRWMKKAVRRHAEPPCLTQAIHWARVSIPFWPHNGSPVSWPPNAHLGNRALEQFMDRWAKVVWR